jgi:hypothetical protein
MMNSRKYCALMGVAVSPLALAGVSLEMARLTFILGALLIPNPETQVVGTYLFSTLLLNGLFGVIFYHPIFGAPLYLL